MAQGKCQKAWCLTWNNPTLTTSQFSALVKNDWNVTYGIFQLEKGEQETKHFQGYFEFLGKKRLTGLKRLLPSAHWESRRGSRSQAREYCRKEESRVEIGVEIGEFGEGGQGTRTDLQIVVAMAQTDGNLRRVMVEHPEVFVKFSRGLRELVMAQQVERDAPPEVFICYGPTGCGKSLLSRQAGIGNYWVDPIGAGSWFDGYMGEPDAIFDDFDGKLSHVRLKDWLRVLDRYALRVPVKGSFVTFAPRRIWVTTNYHPRFWWDWTSRMAQYPALQRRVTRVYHWRAYDPHVIVIDRTEPGVNGLWKRWWEGPDQHAPHRAVLGPMDNYVEQRDPEEWKFDFIEQEEERLEERSEEI